MANQRRPHPREPLDDRLFAPLLADIERDGYTLVSSPGGKGPTKPPFVSTVGLLATYDHPEFLVVGSDDRDLCEVIVCELAERVGGGAGFDGSSKAVLDGIEFTFVEAYPRHLETLTGVSSLIMAQYLRRSIPLRGLQVVLPDRYFCACHARVRYWLDDPRPLLPHRRSRRRGTAPRPA